MALVVRRNPSRVPSMLDPFRRPVNLMEEMDRMWRDVWGTWNPFSGQTTLSHGLDVYEEKNDLVIKAELPGIDKENLSVTLDNGILTIKAEKKEETVHDESSYYTRERHFGQYCRSIALPIAVDEDKIAATLENGILEIRLPKQEETVSKKIDVNVK